MSTLSVLQSRLEERGQQPFLRGAQLAPGLQPFSRGAQLAPGLQALQQGRPAYSRQGVVDDRLRDTISHPKCFAHFN